MTILCVLKTGGIYGAWHVNRLADQIARHGGGRLVCLTDDPVVDPVTVRLSNQWPGWWAKMELFTIPGPALYLDLDVTITGDLSPLVEAARHHDLIACRDFWHPELHGINSSVMAWRGDVSALYRAFAADPERHIREHSTMRRWGDQSFVRDHWPGGIRLWQDLLPGMVLSWKRDVKLGADTGDCRVCVFHGDPKPWHPSVPAVWRGE